MQSKTKQCQNCKSKFTIEPEDFEFYKKIDVPAPTFCPECRLIRRTASWNERVLYKRKCDLCRKSIVSLYSPDKPFKVYCSKCWWSDKWDPMDYGRDYDFNRPFFEQFYELQKDVPIINLLNKKSVNSEYCHDALELKNCYLLFLNGMCENCSYGTFMINDKDCVDNYKLTRSELCYSCVDCAKCYRLLFSEDCHDCHNSAFLFNCSSCSDCFGCVNLKHKKYHIFNQPYSKEGYEEKIKKYDIGSYQSYLKIKKEFEKFDLKFPRKFARIFKSVNVLGDEIINVKNCFQCFKVDAGLEDCKYISVGGWNAKNCYDIYNMGLNMSFSYESVCCVGGAYKAFFTTAVWVGRNIQYSDYCQNASDLFGCVSLKKKQNFILNKQYTKKSFDKLRIKIIDHMNKMPYVDKKGRIYKYGEYFPIELSRFGYNESVANLYFPLTKQQATKQGFGWYDKPKAEYNPTIKAKELPDHIKDTDDSVLKEVIECENSVSDCAGFGVFRIIPSEFKFYKKMGLALPRICPDCRHREKFQKRALFKLWHRKCQCTGTHSSNKVYQNTIQHIHKTKPCPNTFQTTYAPDRKEIVYCEACYQKEIQ